MSIKTLTTRLEVADRDEIIPILDAKANEVGPNRTTDYVGFALDNIDSQIKRIDEAIKELQAIKKEATTQKEIVKAGVAEWLQSNGIDKLQGDIVSSITIYEPAEKFEVIIDNEEAVINQGHFKMAVDKTSVKKYLQEGLAVEGAHAEVTHSEPSIRLNRKKAKDALAAIE